MAVFVPGEGSEDTRIVVFGQAPGKDEMIASRPFVGAAGHMLNNILHNARILRSQIWLDNMAKVQPPGNKIGLYFEGRAPGDKGTEKIVPTPQLEAWIQECRDKVRKIKPNVIVPLGNEALWMCTGLEGITKWRGSILRTWKYFVEGFKVIPTYHPSYLNRGRTHYQPLVECDFRRVKNDSEFPELRLPKPTYYINPSFNDVLEYIELVRRSEWCCCDIETRYSQILTVGLGFDINEAMSIPLTEMGRNRWTEHEEATIWSRLSELLAKHLGITGQGFEYDHQCLGRWGRICCYLPRLDTMVAWHECYPNLPKSLSTFTSVYTRHPYYKDDKKEWMGKIADAKLRTYNCTDVVSQLECAIKLEKELEIWGVREGYDFQMRRHYPFVKMGIMGINSDPKEKEDLTNYYKDQLSEIQARVDKGAGRHINVKSPTLKNYLYVELGIEARFDKYTKQPTTNKKALLDLCSKMSHKDPGDPRVQILRDIIDIGTYRKLIESYADVKQDPYDGRMRFFYGVAGTKTFRGVGGKSIFGGGFSMQTAPVRTEEGRKVRSLFKPDEGKRLANMDLARAEAMLVAWFANEVLMIEMFLRGDDTHWHNAKTIASILGYEGVDMNTEYNKDIEGFYELRYAGKSCAHAVHYMMGPRTMRNTLLTYGLDLPEAVCKEIIITYKVQRPALPQWHLRTGDELRRTRKLETPEVNGVKKKRTFFGSTSPRHFDEMLRDALAWRPQTTTGLVMHTILDRVSKEYTHKGLDILQESHDSFLFQHPEDWDQIKLFKEIDEMGHLPMKIGGRILEIPREFETGPNWGDMEEVKLNG